MDAFITSGLNANALSGGVPVVLTGFSPVVTGVVTWGTNIVFTDASTFPSGDSFGKINIAVSDQHGNSVTGAITAADGTATLSLAGLTQTDSFIVKVTVTSTLGCIADGLVDVPVNATTCTLANYSISFTTTQF